MASRPGGGRTFAPHGAARMTAHLARAAHRLRFGNASGSRQPAPAGGVRHRAKVRPPPGRDLHILDRLHLTRRFAPLPISAACAAANLGPRSAESRSAETGPRTPVRSRARCRDPGRSSSRRDCSIFRCAGPDTPPAVAHAPRRNLASRDRRADRSPCAPRQRGRRAARGARGCGGASSCRRRSVRRG